MTTTRTHVYRIRVRKHAGGSYWHNETYYEPTALSAADRAKLETVGWSVVVGRVSVAREHARLTRAASLYARSDASLRGASSACHGYAIASGVASAHAKDVLAAAEGRGSLFGEQATVS